MIRVAVMVEEKMTWLKWTSIIMQNSITYITKYSHLSQNYSSFILIIKLIHVHSKNSD